MFPNCTEKQNLCAASDYLRQNVLKNKRFFIPPVGKVCRRHTDSIHWIDVTIPETDLMYTAEQITEMVDLLRFNLRSPDIFAGW